jgi:hypothetical protein
MKTDSNPKATSPRVGALLTVAELLEEMARLGLDPATTTFTVGGVPVISRSTEWEVGSGFAIHFTCDHEFDW